MISKSLQSPFVVMPWWSAVGAVLACQCPALAMAGALAWPVVEYLAHRFAMHGLEGTRFYKPIHGCHHSYPNDISHFTIPLAFSAPAVALLSLVVPHAALGGFLLSYVVYDLAHLAAHGLAPFPWRSRLAKRHARHHGEPSKNFGVTSGALDAILRTGA